MIIIIYHLLIIIYYYYYFYYRTAPIPLTFDGANDSSHRQLLESAIRLGKYVFLQKLHVYSVKDPE